MNMKNMSSVLYVETLVSEWAILTAAMTSAGVSTTTNIHISWHNEAKLTEPSCCCQCYCTLRPRLAPLSAFRARDKPPRSDQTKNDRRSSFSLPIWTESLRRPGPTGARGLVRSLSLQRGNAKPCSHSHREITWRSFFKQIRFIMTQEYRSGDENSPC